MKQIKVSDSATTTKLAKMWRNLPMDLRLTFLGMDSNMEVGDVRDVFTIDHKISSVSLRKYAQMIEMKESGEALPADPKVLEWLIFGDNSLPRHDLKDILKSALKTDDLQLLTPCIGLTRKHEKAGIYLSVSQFRNLVTFVIVLANAGMLKLADVKWIANSSHIAVGVSVIDEPLHLVQKLLENSNKLSKNRTKSNEEKIQHPYLIGYCYPTRKATVMHEAEYLTSINLINLGESMCLNDDAISLIRKALPRNMADLYQKGILSEDNGVAEWISFIDNAYQAEHGRPSPLHGMFIVSQPEEDNVELPPDEAEASMAEAPPESAPAEVRKAKRLEREQQFDALPNVLEGLDPFKALYDTAENGFFERAFTGTPMVVDRLVAEAGEGNDTGGNGEGESCNRNYANGTGFSAALTSVVKGNLVFSNVGVFKIVQQRRYNARAMMKLMGTRPDRHLPDIQVLAPHEFGQVPGFVAGQYRALRDRLCTVMVTYDPALWELTLRERKLLIESSKAPKLYVFPRQWLFDLSSAYKWYDAGWFGTPKDPSILDFVIPNGNYDI